MEKIAVSNPHLVQTWKLLSFLQLHVTNFHYFVQKRYISARHPKRIGPLRGLIQDGGRILDRDELRRIIRKYLADKPRNTAEISAWLISLNTPSNSSEMVAVMESDATLVRIGTVHKSGMAGNSPPLSEWATEEWVRHHERNSPKERSE